LGLNLCAHAWKTKDYTIESTADRDVDFGEGTNYAAAFKLVEELSGPAEKEQDEDYVSKTIRLSISHRSWYDGKFSMGRNIHIEVESHELPSCGAFPRIVERVAETDGEP
jgi:hypothetical protein